MKSIIQIAILVLFIYPSTLSAQEKLNISLDNSCSYYGEKIVDDVYSFNSTDEAEEIVGRIVKIVGLEQNFDIKSANVPNALATIKNGSRLILYSQNFILNIKNATGTDWSGISILAHEIGHHLNGHTIISGGSRPNLELQADKFSGFVAAKLGASLSDAQAAISKFSSKSGSSTHPPKSARLEAIAIGWNQGNSGSKPPSEPEPVRESSNEKENVISNTTTTARIIYTGDNYGCGLPIQITIGNKTFTPNNNSFEVSGIPLGTQKYSIQGQINCPAIGGCSASGQGTLNISENATFYISWQNVSFGQCNIWLQPG